MTIARDLARYADELSYDDLDEETIEAAKVCLVDSVACCFAAMREESVETLLAHMEDRQGTEARIVGGGTASVENATFTNGTLVRYVDWNDSYVPMGHPSDNFGAILSVGDFVEATGEQIILAAVLAYEVQCRLGDAQPVTIMDSGVDHTVHGLTSSAVAVGKLFGLSQTELAETINMSLGGHIPLRQIRNGKVSDFKGMAFANASRNAVFAARLAKEGLDGPKPVWEGKDGLNNLISHDDMELDVDSFGGDGTEFRIHQVDLKPYPCFYHGQSAADCALKLLEEHDIRPEEIVKIESETYSHANADRRSEQWHPTTRGSADHSMPWVIARAFIDGEIALEGYEEGNILTEETIEVLDKITISTNERFEEAYPEKYPHRMRVVTGDSEYETHLEYPRGHSENPLSKAELEEKFRSQYEYLRDGNAEDLLEWLWELETHDSLDEFFELTE